VSAGLVGDFGSAAGAVQHTLSGPDLRKLSALSERVVKKLAQVPGA